jgi:hypothetical protein
VAAERARDTVRIVVADAEEEAEPGAGEPLAMAGGVG